MSLSTEVKTTLSGGQTSSGGQTFNPLVPHMLYWSSGDRQNRTTTASNPATCQLIIPIGSVVEVELLTANIPKSFPNVAAALNNNLFTFTDVGTGGHTITIPDGQYSASDLLSYMQTQMNALSSNYTVALSTSTGRVTISNSSFAFTIDGTQTNTVMTRLGFLPQVYAGLQTYTGTYVINLSKPYTVFIVWKEVGAASSSTGLQNGYNWPISVVSGAPYDIVTWSQGNNFETRVKISKKQLLTNTFTLTDANGAALNLNGADWDLSIRCWCEPTGLVR